MAVILSVGAVWAQRYAAHGVTLHGEIDSTSTPVGALTVELTPDGSGISEQITVNPDNSFDIRSLTPGIYQLRVVAAGGQTIHQEKIGINGVTQNITVHLTESNTGSASRSAGNVVSMNQLQHKIPARAQKLFNKAEQARAKRNLPEASEYYRQAVEADPGFVDAHTQLGSAEAALGRLPEAAEEFQKAIDIVPDHHLALLNLSIVLAKLRRFHEAGEVARRDLKVVPGSGRTHYILAASLIQEKGNMDEAIDHLERAGDDIPSAHLAASDLLLERGRRNEAVRQIEQFLLVASPSDALRAKAEARLSELQQH
jgi:tetratricopeptide (TPR) repeat protein